MAKKRSIDYYKEPNLSTLSLSTLYRIRKAEKESEGTFYWYFWPCNIKAVLKRCISAKLNEKRIRERNQ
ncbi:hypothetical protein GO755_33550 [Spirosoma sp. HMF4905]|uniref:Uncharacterized protein n=1 Tax=Spirosoma arboris TaxID=2682092 RepID=A0A7K1SMH9_9BACT|nr:hypothetical protein [Spirosoma arboris]MVM35002.1 hypothetical protein [Spirosoma arboris]